METPNVSPDLVQLILNATLLAKLILAILLVFSAISWGVVASKYAQLRRASAQTAAFLEVFRRSSRFSEVQAACGNLTASPLVGLFQAGHAEVNAQLRHTATAADPAKPAAAAPRPTLKSMEALDRALLRAAGVEVARLEKRVSFLATTASITPYIGLLGTVIGIMNSFIGIANTNTTNLAVVAPGIAEALLATGIGLFAAIPAVMFYNYFQVRISAYGTRSEGFVAELLNAISRQLDKGA